jgi:hypothetical protein
VSWLKAPLGLQLCPNTKAWLTDAEVNRLGFLLFRDGKGQDREGTWGVSQGRALGWTEKSKQQKPRETKLQVCSQGGAPFITKGERVSRYSVTPALALLQCNPSSCSGH